MDAKNETLMCIAKCKRKDGKILDYYVHRFPGGVVEIIGLNLERHRCQPGVTSIEAARIEIAKVCHVEVISISEWPSHPGALSSKKDPRRDREMDG
jgi:hypothetical protein